MITKIILAAFVCFSIVACCSSKPIAQATSTSSYFTLLSAVSEKWSSPRPGGGKREEYYFTIKTTTANQLLFDSAWVQNNGYALFVIKKDAPVSNEPVAYGNGDTLIVRISAQSPASQPSTPPVVYKGDALLRYAVNQTQQYFVVPIITKQPTLHHQ